MSFCARRGFSVIDLAAVTGIVLFLALTLLPGLTDVLKRSYITGVRARGRDIYTAITGADTEREPLGLPPVWPADKGSYENAVAGDISSVAFTNSTECFRCLYGETHIGTERWNPVVAGFDYSKVSGWGVPMCTDGRSSLSARPTNSSDK